MGGERGGIEQIAILRPAFWQHYKIQSTLPDANGLEKVGLRGPQRPGRWYFFVDRRRFDWLYSTPAPGKRPSSKQSQPRSPKLTSSEPAVASEKELHGAEKDVCDAMRDNPPRKNERDYARNLWQRKFKKKEIKLHTIANYVSKHRKEFEVEADTEKSLKKSSRRK